MGVAMYKALDCKEEGRAFEHHDLGQQIRSRRHRTRRILAASPLLRLMVRPSIQATPIEHEVLIPPD